MGLASKLQAAQGMAGAAGAMSGKPSAPPYPGAPAYGAPPQGQYGAPGQQPGQYGAPGQQPGQYGAPGQQPGQYGAPGQQPGQYGAPGQQPGQYGAPGQQPGQYGAPGQQPGQYGAPGQQPGQYGGPGQQPGQYGAGPPQGQQPGQSGAPGQQGQFGAPGQGQYGAPGGFGGAPPAGGFDANTVRNKLQQTIAQNQLMAFYPPQALEQVVQRVVASPLAEFGAKWRLPREIVLDLVALALYNVILYCDDSGSMAFEEGGERIDDLKMILGRVADAATLFDHDGISARFMNSSIEANNIKSAVEATNLLGQVKFAGTTPLGTGLERKVLQPFVLGPARSNQLPKPTLVVTITDGEPTGEPADAVRSTIIQSKRFLQGTPFGPGAVAFQFAQVGKDQGAVNFLASLDQDPEVGKFIDCTSYYELEQAEFMRKGIDLTPELWLVKLLVGAVDPSYDDKDEHR